jgi:hypothetical protein
MKMVGMGGCMGWVVFGGLCFFGVKVGNKVKSPKLFQTLAAFDKECISAPRSIEKQVQGDTFFLPSILLFALSFDFPFGKKNSAHMSSTYVF